MELRQREWEAVSLNEVCEFWNLKQSEVNYVLSKFEGKSYWENNKTLEKIHIHDRGAFEEQWHLKLKTDLHPRR